MTVVLNLQLRYAYLSVVVQDLATMLTPDATQLVATKWHSSVKLVPSVHPDSAGLQPPAHCTRRCGCGGVLIVQSNRTWVSYTEREIH